MTEPWEMTATAALAAMRARDLSPVELLSSVERRADQVEPVVNALCERRHDEALVAAEASAQRYAGGERIRPLEGLPVALKEEVPVTGWRMRYGSLAVDEIAEETAPIAERIMKAGAVVHARTTTPEFRCVGYTHSKLWGVTRNPWNPSVAAGGSSGGSGASLASGTSLLASGSDIGGSIRVPASINGVVGFKPPHGRVPTGPPFNLDRYCHDGPLARTVADCAVFENALAGPHPADVTSLRPKLRIPAELTGIEGWRIALSVDLGAWDIAPEVEANTRAAAAALEEAGAIVEEVEIPWTLEQVVGTARRHFAAIFGAEIGSAAEEHGELLNDYAHAWAEEAQMYRDDARSFLAGLEGEQAMWEPIGALFRRYRAIVCPTWAVTGITAGDSYLGTLFDGGGQNDRQFTCFMTTPFNVLSPCPVLAVPSGAAPNGVPTGVQIVARTYDDVGAFRIGAALERARPWAGVQREVPAFP
jgi:Asp-tRNA(Asn)/Glu-tRNA(Gln) amidotransferase A subunit family amidase